MNRLKLIIVVALVTLMPSVSFAVAHKGDYFGVSISPTVVPPGDEILIEFSYTLWGYIQYPNSYPWRVALDGDGTNPNSGIELASGDVIYNGPTDPGMTYNISFYAPIPSDTEPGTHEIHIWSAAGPRFGWPSKIYFLTTFNIVESPIGSPPLNLIYWNVLIRVGSKLSIN